MDGAGATCANQALELIATTEQRWHDLGSIVERDSDFRRCAGLDGAGTLLGIWARVLHHRLPILTGSALGLGLAMDRPRFSVSQCGCVQNRGPFLYG